MSCLANLLYFLEAVTGRVDYGYPVNVINLDFSEAI